MIRQDREQGMRWRNLILPFLLPIVAMLLLLYLLSPNVAAESDIPLLKMARSDEEIRASSHANSINLSCHTCALSVENTSLPQTVPPRGSANYELSVENTGDCTGTLTLTSTSQRGWDVDVIPPLPITLPVGSPPTAVTLTHTVPTHEPGGTVDVVTVTAVLDCRLPCGNCNEKAITLTTTVREFGVELEPDRSASAAADDVVRFTHTLTNTGNYTDVFGFKATSTLSSSISIPAKTSVGPLSSTTMPVTVVVSPSAKRGQEDTIVITATSTNDPDTSDYVIDQIEVITSGCEAELGITEPIQSAIPGETVTYTLTVSNTGACTGTAGIETDVPEDWSPVVTPPPTKTLSPEESADWLVSLTVPPDEYPGTRTTNITAVLTCTTISTTDTDPDDITTIVSTPMPLMEPDIVKTIPVTEDIINRGMEVIFTHTLTNTGNLTDTFYFTVHSAQGWDRKAPNPEPDVGPNEPRMVIFSVTISPHVQIYSDTIVITATPGRAPAHSDTATDRIRDGRVFLPIIIRCACLAAPLRNGDFETGGLSYWRSGGELPVEIAHGLPGRNSARLGYPPNYSCSALRQGSAWLEQTFSVPSGPPVCGHPRLSFSYEMHTQDNETNDTFEVYLNGYQILKIGHTGSATKCTGDEVVISKTCTIDLADPKDCDGKPIDASFLCSKVTLRFENWNRNHTWYNTWIYVDDVQFTW